MKSNRIIKISTPDIFSFKECVWFLNRNFDDCLHSITGDTVTKAIEINNQVLLVHVSAPAKHLKVEILQGEVDAETEKALTEYITEWFDLDRDLKPFYNLLRKTKATAFLANDYYGLRLPSISDMFEALCWGIIGQQINLVFAYKLKRRLVEKYGTSISFNNETYHIFPHSEVLALATVEDLRVMQFSEKKAEYIIGAAKAFTSGEISKVIIQNHSSLEAKQKALLSMRGVGIWTANYVLMKSLREQSSIPHGDAGLLNALIKYKIIDAKNETDKIDKFFKKYKGRESYLVFYLWRTLS
ncbi:DNA-3-methyladenine glycosylase family protein [Chitinophagaceae bacterium LWZ2-11]